MESKIPENKDGKYIDGTIEVTYYYSKIEDTATGDTLHYILVVLGVSILGVTYTIRKKIVE